MGGDRWYWTVFGREVVGCWCMLWEGWDGGALAVGDGDARRSGGRSGGAEELEDDIAMAVVGAKEESTERLGEGSCGSTGG